MGMPDDLQLLVESALSALRVTRSHEDQVIADLETSGSTQLVVGLRLFRLHRAIVAVGMLSMFEALLQDELSLADPFAALPDLLKQKGRLDLANRFVDYKLAINVLKHGTGKSYQELINKKNLEFKIKYPKQPFLEEGDVSEVNTLIEVDDAFVQNCAALIREVFEITVTQGTNLRY